MHAIEDHHADPILDSLLSREIVIDNRGNSNEHEDYQVELDIAGDHLFFPDQNSLRFIDSNLQSINYWNESFPGKLWLKVPKIPASVFSTVRLFEGHPSEESKSNGDDTFEFFDDFNGVPYDKLFDSVAVEPQEKYSGNPILQQGSSGQWDDYGIRDQSLLTDQYGNVVIESGKHILYYGGHDGTDIHIGRAEFERPSVLTIQNMAKNANNPLLSPSDMGWASGYVSSCCPIKKGTNDYILYFCGKEMPGGYNAIYYATSTDGISWTPNTTPILSISGHQLTMVNVRQIQYGTNAGTIVLYVEYDAGPMYHATSSNWTSGWSWDSGNPIITTADISWATVSGPCNPKFIELAEDKYIMGITANSAPTTYDRVGFMKSQSLNSDWEDYGEFVLDAGAGGAWDDVRIESGELVKDDIGNNIIGMFYFGCPTTHSMADGAIGYTTIDQDALEQIIDSDKWSGSASISNSKATFTSTTITRTLSQWGTEHAARFYGNFALTHISNFGWSNADYSKHSAEGVYTAYANFYSDTDVGDTQSSTAKDTNDHVFEIKRGPTGTNTFYVDADDWSDTAQDTGNLYVASKMSTSGSVTLDWVFVRKCISPEPTAEIGAMI